MAAFRATKKGQLSFGLVNVPVKLMKATEDHDVKFHQVHAGCGGGVSMPRVCKDCGETVAYADLAKGIEYGGSQVVVTTDELKELEDEAGSAIEVLEFVDATEIDPIMYEGTYYLEPDGTTEGYALLRQVLVESGRVGVVRYTHGKTHMGVLRVMGNVMVIHPMRWADEVRDAAGLKNVPAATDLNPKAVAMAHALVESMVGTFDAAAYTDTYTERVGELVAAKAGGTKLTLVKAEAPAEGVDDLMAMLEASIKAAS